MPYVTLVLLATCWDKRKIQNLKSGLQARHEVPCHLHTNASRRAAAEKMKIETTSSEQLRQIAVVNLGLGLDTLPPSDWLRELMFAPYLDCGILAYPAHTLC